MKRKAFTLIELLVVLAILALLMGALTTSVANAKLRAAISKASGQANEMTNAIRAYANSVDTALPSLTDAEAGESTLAFLLGSGTDRGGKETGVLYNANMVGGRILDPWGNPYLVTIKAAAATATGNKMATGLEEGVFIPNRYGRRATASLPGGGGQ